MSNVESAKSTTPAAVSDGTAVPVQSQSKPTMSRFEYEERERIARLQRNQVTMNALRVAGICFSSVGID